MLYLGIDQHKRQLTVNLRGEDGSVILKRQVSTQWEKVRAFFAGIGVGSDSCCIAAATAVVLGDAETAARSNRGVRVPRPEPGGGEEHPRRGSGDTILNY